MNKELTTTLADRLKCKLNEGKVTLALQGLAAPQSGPQAVPTEAAIAVVKHQQCLLLDCSSSMAEDVEPNCSKHEALRRLLPQFVGTRRFAFSDACRELVGLPPPGGSTDLAGAFVTIKQRGIRHAVLVTDGRPDDESSALREANGLRLDIFYVGPPPRPAFLDRLAAATGGSAHSGKLDPRGVGKIAASVRQILALPPGRN